MGSVVGGTEGALIAGSADRFNRQLHPTEIDLIKENADVFAEENNLRDENGELDVAQAEQQLTQAFLSEADNAWDIAYDNQGVVISEDATAFIAGLREQHAETGEFTVQEGDRENRLLNASTVRSDLEFYYDNAATDRGRTLLDAKDLNSNGAIYDIEAFQQGEAAGERETKNDITAETNNAIAEGLENADDIGLDVLNRVGDFAANPIGSIIEHFVEVKEEDRIKQLQQNTKNEVVLLETLEGDAYSVGYLEGSENAIFHAEVENAIGVGLLGGSVARVLADDLPNRSSQDDINTVHLEKDVAPNKELLPLSNVGVSGGNVVAQTPKFDNVNSRADGDFGALNQTPKQVPPNFKNLSPELSEARTVLEKSFKETPELGVQLRDSISQTQRNQLANRYEAVAKNASEIDSTAARRAAALNRDRASFLRGETNVPPGNTKTNPKYREIQ